MARAESDARSYRGANEWGTHTSEGEAAKSGERMTEAQKKLLQAQLEATAKARRILRLCSDPPPKDTKETP